MGILKNIIACQNPSQLCLHLSFKHVRMLMARYQGYHHGITVCVYSTSTRSLGGRGKDGKACLQIREMNLGGTITFQRGYTPLSDAVTCFIHVICATSRYQPLRVENTFASLCEVQKCVMEWWSEPDTVPKSVVRSAASPFSIYVDTEKSSW